MKSAIIWKLILSAVAVGLAVLNLFPINNQDFAQTVQQQVRANAERFAVYFDAAQARVSSGQTPSLVLALKQEAHDRQIDLQESFFPQVEMVAEPELDKKNDIIVNHLYSLSRGRLQKGLDLEGGASFILQMSDPDNKGKEFSREDLNRAIAIIDGRVNALGVAEPIIRPIPPNRIEVQMPGVSLQENPEAAETLIRAARLEFRTTHRYLTPDDSVRKGEVRTLPIDPRNPNETALYECMVQTSYHRGQRSETRMWVKKIAEAQGDIVQDAYAMYEQNGRPSVGLTLTTSAKDGQMSGKDIFGKLTTDIYNEDRATGTKQYLAIVLDGNLESAPGINTPITQGQATISGSYTENEIRELVSALNNPLAYDLRVGQKSEIGPSLAADARSDSINAALYGAGLVILCMLIYYFSAGVVAVISVAFTMALVLGVMASLGATLTLPGIAALVLTVATAVDGNILVFERMREELRTGKDVRTALSAGYEKALSTIVDANLTTLITAVILIYFGHGPIKGFGVTLCIGIGASMFGALIFSRALLEIMVHLKLGGRLVPARFEKGFNFRFMHYSRRMATIAWTITAIGVLAVVVNWNNIAGVDFRGGAELTLEFKPEARSVISVSEIENISRRDNLGEIVTVFQTALGGSQRLKVQMDDAEGRPDQVLAALQQAFPQAELKELSRDIIGATVSNEIVNNAILSVVLASIAIMFYIAVRFEWGFAVGVLVSTVHDILISIGLFVILGQYFGIGSGQFSAPMIAGVLMVIGYSLNDTIIVFDRIREELQLNPSATLAQIVDHSINRTLSRTMLTSFTTFIAAVALAVYGTGIVADFALLFLIGVVMGTFSSIYIASPVFYWWHKGSRQSVTDKEVSVPVYEWEARTPRKPATPKIDDGSKPSA